LALDININVERSELSHFELETNLNPEGMQGWGREGVEITAVV